MAQQGKSQSLTNETLLSASDILRILDIPKHKLDYLFESRKLSRKGFTTLSNGHRIYKKSDLNKIRQALFEVSTKSH
jgi:hypothetical protein